MTPQILYRTGAQALALPGELARVIHPLAGRTPDGQQVFSAYGFEVNFECLISNYPPAPLNTPSTATLGPLGVFGLNAFTPPSATQASSNAILTKLSPPQNSGGANAKFTGTFHVVPATWNDFRTQLVNFPGFIDSYAYPFGVARPVIPRKAIVRLQYDYFVVDPAAVIGTSSSLLDSSGAAITVVASESLIPLIARTPWLSTHYDTGQPNSFIETNDLVKTGGYRPIGSSTLYLQTAPPTDIYVQWCAVAKAFTATWDATHPPLWDGASMTDTTIGQYVLETSQLNNYAGNIVERVTTFAMPQ